MLGKIIEPCFAGRGVGHDGVKHVQRSDVDERDLVELTAVEDQDPRFRAAQHGLLRLRVELGGIRDPGFQIDALAAHHGLVNVVAPQCLLRLVADEGQRFRLEPPAGQEDRPALHVAQLHDQLDRIRDDGQVFLFRIS